MKTLERDDPALLIADPEALIEEARTRQRRRHRRLATILVLAVAGGAGLLISKPSGGGRGPKSASVASPSQIQTFLKLAQRGTQGVFAETYAVTTASGHGGTMRLQVSAAQRSHDLIRYQVTPAAFYGEGANRSFEVFAAEAGQKLPQGGSGLYSCSLPTVGASWSCTGPYTGIGMSTTSGLLGPYPPQALLVGLQNAAETYTGVPGGRKTAGGRAVLFSRTVGGRSLRCLKFERGASQLGSVCLAANGVIASYDIPGELTFVGYGTATLRSYSEQVALSTFDLPSRP
ncbi:MAG: hypothetical protein M0027_05465 [Candidatus Dormibacteraeota bacterium]|nr:hypothetical protein [Candidatus Dormibacteraeota bacterium]